MYIKIENSLIETIIFFLKTQCNLELNSSQLNDLAKDLIAHKAIKISRPKNENKTSNHTEYVAKASDETQQFWLKI